MNRIFSRGLTSKSQFNIAEVNYQKKAHPNIVTQADAHKFLHFEFVATHCDCLRKKANEAREKINREASLYPLYEYELAYYRAADKLVEFFESIRDSYPEY